MATAENYAKPGLTNVIFGLVLGGMGGIIGGLVAVVWRHSQMAVA